jgi:hypothetical protein
MGFKRFNVCVTAAVLAVVTLFAASSYWVNIYGLFGEVRGKSYSVLGTERTAKYLFSFNYIPSNFDSLLIGSSISDNWDVSSLRLGRFYNASISGGNISEEALIAENVFRRRPLKTALFVIYPYLTETYGRKSGYMTPQEYWSALGSVQLLSAYASEWAIDRGLLRQDSTPSGQFVFEAQHGPVAALARMNAAEDEFPVDDRAINQYRDLLAAARTNGARVIGVIPVVSKSFEDLHGAAFTRYNAKIRSLFLRGETIIDLNAVRELDGLRCDASNFPDGNHLTTAAAAEVMRMFDAHLQ